MKESKAVSARILAAKIARNANEYIAYSVDIKNKMSAELIKSLTKDLESKRKSPVNVRLIVKSAIA